MSQSIIPVTLLHSTKLKQLVPIGELQEEHCLLMAHRSNLIEMKMGETLVANDEHRWLLYLLEGSLKVQVPKQQNEVINAGEERARHPVFGEKGNKSLAVAQTTCKVVRFSRQQFNTLINVEMSSYTNLADPESDDKESVLLNTILDALESGDLKLPSLPDIALKIKTAAARPDVSLADIARIVGADPVMAARLIQVANSPIHRAPAPVNSIRDATARLGLISTCNLVIGLSMKQIFNTKNSMLADRLHKLYDRSVEVAAICFALGHRAKLAHEDNLLLAGLVHDIGVIPILAYIDSVGLKIETPEELEEIIAKLRGVVGGLVIRNWGLPAELVTVVEEAKNWHRNSGDNLDICDLVIIAQIYSMLQNNQVNNLPKINEVPAFHKLFKGKPDMEFAKQILHDAHDEVVEIMKLLKN